MTDARSFFRTVFIISSIQLGAPSLTLAQAVELSGIVTDETGGVIRGAQLVLRTIQGATIQMTRSSADGRFTMREATPGSYVLEVTAENFEVRRLSVNLNGRPAAPLEIALNVGRMGSEITVTAERGVVGDVREAPPIVTVRELDDARRQPLATMGNVLEGATGVLVQQSTYGQASPFLRGLTGYQVLNLIDGVRYNNSTFRSGPNQYLAFVDPSQAQRVEAMLGPSSSQFGSDAMGGTIQLLTPTPQLEGSSGRQITGGVHVFGASADRSGGGDAAVVLRGSRLFFSLGANWRELNDLRAGGRRDSHHVLKRLFDLSDDQIRSINDGRQTGTGFSQSGVHTKLAVRLGEQHNVTTWFQASETDGVQGYKDLWGGLGRMRSDFDPQRLKFFYSRYETLGMNGLDSLSGTFSINSQTDGSIRQNLNLSDPITTDEARVDAFGYAVQATAHLASRHAFVFGGEIYHEHIDARREVTSPPTGRVEQRRALYPNGSEYRTSGLFAQDVLTIAPDRLRAVIGGRFTHVQVETFSDRNRSDSGVDLGVVDSDQTFHDWTYNVGLTWQATDALSLNFLTGRGFRAPNLNDLGALGLNDLGYEVPASAALDTGGLVGASDGEGALSTGRPVTGLKAERLFNYELGAALRRNKLYTRVHFFDAELKEPIVRRTLLFPLESLPSSLSAVPVVPIPPSNGQRAQGVGSVATSLDPRAVKAFVNDGAARYYGLDALVNYRLGTRWQIEGTYSYLVGHDLNPTRPVRRLPPQQTLVTARYQPGGRLAWIEAGALVSGSQSKLSGGDITDERIGAARSRNDINSFFRGSLIAPYVLPGADGRLGTADDVFGVTQETVAQIRDRVLPLGATINGVTVVDDSTRVPLYLETPAFVRLDLGAGLTLARRVRLDLAMSNVLDRNYRVHGSGVDAPGVNVFARLRITY
jgi:hemoglobin/transferrin/lactoferrin receptor protein